MLLATTNYILTAAMPMDTMFRHACNLQMFITGAMLITVAITYVQ